MKNSFFYRAAWASLLIPFIVFGGVVGLCLYCGHTPSDGNNEVVGYYLEGAFGASVVGLILGIVSLFGIQREGGRSILWKAVVGIVAGLIMGFIAFIFVALHALGHM